MCEGRRKSDFGKIDTYMQLSTNRKGYNTKGTPEGKKNKTSNTS